MCVIFVQELNEVWVQMLPHPLQSQEPNGDRHWISTYPVLKVTLLPLLELYSEDLNTRLLDTGNILLNVAYAKQIQRTWLFY